MELLIAQAATMMGVDAGAAQMVLGGLLNMAQTNLGAAGPGLMAQIPGAEALLAGMAGEAGGVAGAASSLLGGSSDGGGLGGLAAGVLGGSADGGALGGLAASALGDNAGAASALAGLMGQSGVGAEQLLGAAGLLNDYVAQEAGPQAATTLMGALPGLDLLTGG